MANANTKPSESRIPELAFCSVSSLSLPSQAPPPKEENSAESIMGNQKETNQSRRRQDSNLIMSRGHTDISGLNLESWENGQDWS